MPLPKLSLPPSTGNYNVSFGNELVSVTLDGGLPRIRRDIAGACHTVTCSWLLDATAYNTLLTFYNTTVAKGSLPFLIDLIIDTASLVEYTAMFVPKSFSLSGQSGATYNVAAVLTVKAQ
jgi:hypothetical protein